MHVRLLRRRGVDVSTAAAVGTPKASRATAGSWCGRCFTALAVIFGVSYSFAAFFESFAAEFQASRAEVSLVFGLSGLVYFVLGAFGGMLSDRFGPRARHQRRHAVHRRGAAGRQRRRLRWLQLTAAYGLGLGVGIALVYTPAIGCVQPWFTRRRGLAAGLASAGIGAGTLVGAAAGRGGHRAVAVARRDVGAGRWAWRCSAWPPRCCCAARRRPRAAPTAPCPARRWREALRSRSFLWLYAMCVLGAPAMFIPFAHLSAAARDLGVADAQAVGLVGLIGIGSLTGRFAIGALADRVGRPLTLVLAQASLGLSMLLWLAAGGYPRWRCSRCGWG